MTIEENMKPLASNQRILTWLCVLPAKENTDKWKKSVYIGLVLGLIVADLTVFTSSILYVRKFMSTDLLKTSVGLYQALAAIPMANTIVVTFFLRHKIPSVIEKLLDFYETYKNDESFRFMAHANNKSEWLWKMYIKFVMSGVIVVVILLSIASALICWLLNGYFDATQAFHPYHFILPWDQSTLLGYFCEIIYTILIGEAFFLYNGIVLLLFASICLHHQAFYKMFHHSIRKLDHPDKNRTDKEILCEIIDFHISIKSWFSDTVGIYSLNFMMELICHMLMLAVYVFQMDQLIFNDFDLDMFIFSLLSISFALFVIFLLCFLGKLASESYKEIVDSLYDCNWHELPLSLQKYFIMMIANAQIPMHYHGYDLITLNLETFCKLLKAAFTYYMMFKTLSSE